MKNLKLKGKPLSIYVHRASECLTDHLPHGEGLIAHSLIQGLAERGHKLWCYSNDVAIENLHDNIQVFSKKCRLPANSLYPWAHNRNADKLFARLNRFQHFDLVWRMYPFNNACPTAPVHRNIPLVVGPLHDSWPNTPSARFNSAAIPRYGVSISRFVEPFARRGWDQTLKAAKLIICEAKRIMHPTSDLAPSARIEYLPLIVMPPSDFAHVDRVNSDLRKGVVIAFVGRLIPHKNPCRFIEIISTLKKRGYRVVGRIFGDGVMKEQLVKRIAELGLDENIEFVGLVSNKQIFEQLMDCHFLISTSIREPYGRSIVEAMSVGTVPICHMSGGPSEFITNKKDGILIDSMNPEEYANSIEAIIHSENWLTLSQNAVQASLSWRSAVVIPQLESLLHWAASTVNSSSKP